QRLEDLLRGGGAAARRRGSVDRGDRLAAPGHQGSRAQPRAAPGADPPGCRLQRRPGAGEHQPHRHHHRRDRGGVRRGDHRIARGGTGVSVSKPVPEIYRRLGVRPVIHGSGTTTRYGGSRLRPEVFETMREASQALVNIDELNAAAGAAIAKMLGAEAAFVTAGASSGLILQSAACIAGDDPAKITRLPDTTGMRNEIVIQRAHRFAYDQAYKIPGGVLVDIGLAR